jgi:hypothetical protein
MLITFIREDKRNQSSPSQKETYLKTFNKRFRRT